MPIDPTSRSIEVGDNFRDKFVGFVDILGFKQMVRAAEKGGSPSLADLIRFTGDLGFGNERQSLEKSGPKICPAAPFVAKNLDFRVTQISDSVILSAEVSSAGLIHLIWHCWGAVIELLAHGIMCRGYIKRGSIYHTDKQVIGSGYQDAYLAESGVTAFKREADERGTPYVQLDNEIDRYVGTQADACVKELFSRMVLRDGDTTVLFPFKRLSHSFIVAGWGHKFDPDKEHASNQKVREGIIRMQGRVWSYVDRGNPAAVRKAEHYIAALDKQLKVCDDTDEMIRRLQQPMPWRPFPFV